MYKQIIETNGAPQAIGTYSQGVQVGKTVYISGQIPLRPGTEGLLKGDIGVKICQVFENLQAIAFAAGGTLEDIVKLNVYLTDLDNFAEVNKIMAEFMVEPYPARAVVEVAALPKGAEIEMDAVLVLAYEDENEDWQLDD